MHLSSVRQRRDSLLVKTLAGQVHPQLLPPPSLSSCIARNASSSCLSTRYCANLPQWNVNVHSLKAPIRASNLLPTVLSSILQNHQVKHDAPRRLHPARGSPRQLESGRLFDLSGLDPSRYLFGSPSEFESRQLRPYHLRSSNIPKNLRCRIHDCCYLLCYSCHVLSG